MGQKDEGAQEEALWKQQARDRGKETGSDNDDEVAADLDWDVLEDEYMLTDAHRPMQGPFPFHVEGSESVRLVEVGRTISPSSGPVGAGESAAPFGVPPEDRWMGGGGSAITPKVLMEGGGSAAAPRELTGAGGSTATPEASTERGGSIAAPSEIRETRPPCPGAGGRLEAVPPR